MFGQVETYVEKDCEICSFSSNAEEQCALRRKELFADKERKEGLQAKWTATVERAAGEEEIRRTSKAMMETLGRSVGEYVEKDGTLSAAGEEELKRVEQFLRFVRGMSGLTSGELAQGLVLLERVVEWDIAEKAEQRTGSVAISTVGTLLLCCVVVAEKMNRDRPLSNGAFSRSLGLECSVLNASERIFLGCVGHRCVVEAEEFWEECHRVFGWDCA
ncbi:uncharacterized protein MONOS_7624 [Monocercomonoides exilis]|uniref:uncharacterized protein n=1 Tax=Monocercomonoides exilis TaxID=2049356 RepID=UPI00355AA8E2|nr:hypothetical protein MONOS_7624 [Monocercomonoides exilis]|eukprot:MONOS_7624.1-p1 / transcript=MONOS_7624.1 / gene=MONOS_7624 / organism=Monocercomonoides_exilis_PA203 / gene_product=unspecified product / transcript_product=unspecified product / location=Mono_scaffold00265:58565-59368(+) / protein_length=216 / sequence_SO=supercontig / SO=protein_coding / is_pseudo=false